MLMANAVSQMAAKTPGKEATAMEAFASALRQVCASGILSSTSLFLFFSTFLLGPFLFMPLFPFHSAPLFLSLSSLPLSLSLPSLRDDLSGVFPLFLTFGHCVPISLYLKNTSRFSKKLSSPKL